MYDFFFLLLSSYSLEIIDDIHVWHLHLVFLAPILCNMVVQNYHYCSCISLKRWICVNRVCLVRMCVLAFFIHLIWVKSSSSSYAPPFFFYFSFNFHFFSFFCSFWTELAKSLINITYLQLARAFTVHTAHTDCGDNNYEWGCNCAGAEVGIECVTNKYTRQLNAMCRINLRLFSFFFFFFFLFFVRTELDTLFSPSFNFFFFLIFSRFTTWFWHRRIEPSEKIECNHFNSIDCFQRTNTIIIIIHMWIWISNCGILMPIYCPTHTRTFGREKVATVRTHFKFSFNFLFDGAIFVVASPWWTYFFFRF